MTAMDCESFEDRLDAFEGGLLPSEEREAAARHLSACARCRALLGIVRGEANLLAAELQDDLARSILCRTSGPACDGAEQLLCAWVDGNLRPDDGEIIRLHIDHCPDCCELAATLTEMKEVLPGMATLEPDARFTADVFSATAGLRSRIREARQPLDFPVWWSRLIRRPRFAWEAAYVGTLLVLLALGNPAVLPKALAVPQVVIQSGNQIMQETATALAGRQESARRSLNDLHLRGRSLAEKAADFPIRTASTLRGKASSFLEELKLDLFDGNGTDQQRDVR
ncbi:MAG: zf-HC2 domain-containing protein [Acidobacteriia bacterium]|nr:zf-HC2 domain-containing protein [Terriglobia bacterium]